jgi:hypothetical protein
VDPADDDRLIAAVLAASAAAGTGSGAVPGLAAEKTALDEDGA